MGEHIDVLTGLASLLSWLNPPPVVSVTSDQLVMIGRIGFVLVPAGVLGAAASTRGMAPALVGGLIGGLVGLLGAAQIQDHTVIILCLVYGVVSRIIDGVASGLALGRISRGIADHHTFTPILLALAPRHVITFVVLALTGLTMARATEYSPRFRDNMLFLTGATLLAGGGVLFEPATVGGTLVFSRLVFPISFAIGIVAAFRSGK
jgi:hypothetical protein